MTKAVGPSGLRPVRNTLFEIYFHFSANECLPGTSIMFPLQSQYLVQHKNLLENVCFPNHTLYRTSVYPSDTYRKISLQRHLASLLSPRCVTVASF